MYIGLQLLRAKIRGLNAAGQSIHHRIGKTSGDRKHRLWGEKRYLGTQNRHQLIAYCLLRNIPYERIERCAENNKPNASMVYAIMHQHAPWDIAQKLAPHLVQDLLTERNNMTLQELFSKPQEEKSNPVEMNGARRISDKIWQYFGGAPWEKRA